MKLRFFELGLVLIFVFQLSNKSDGQDLDSLIKEVSKSERFFDQMQAKYQLVKTSYSNSKDPKLLKKCISNVSVKWSGDKYHCIDDGQWEMGDGTKKNMVYTQAFDGQATRLNNFGEIGNIVDERIMPYCVKPTLLAMPHIGKCLQLSQALDFNTSMMPGLSVLRWHTTKTKVVGREKKNGLQCIKVEINSFVRFGEKPTGKHVLWIAPQKNYHVAASESFFPHVNSTEPVRVYNVEEWMEVESGFWMPKSVSGDIF